MDFRLERGLTLEEALHMAYDDDIDVREIFIEPPDSNILTDEDSGEEDSGGMLDNLSGRQLSQKAEVILNQPVASCSPEPEEFLFERPGMKDITWLKGDFEEMPKQFPQPDYTRYDNMSYIDIFEYFLDEDIIQLIVDESNKYALFCNKPHPNISEDEMKCVIAILIVTGYNELPGRDYYWDSKADMKNALVCDSMRRDRFRQILKYLHCSDNTKPHSEDKMWKLRPLMDLLKRKFIDNWIPEQQLDYDESMIKYFGKHSCKQFIRGKPIRFGYKMWCLNSTSGYLVNFDLYQGKNPRGNSKYEVQFGKCAAPLINMIDEFPEHCKHLPIKFYLDNLFTSFNLLYYLKQKGYDGTGTMRENRIPKSCNLPPKKVMSKTKKRGDLVSAIDREDGILITKWMDNNVVIVASTCHGINPVTKAKRYSQSEKKMIQVSQPKLITEYNKCMGGTDFMDQQISRYRISLRRKTWWWSIFTWLLDAAVVNAWITSK
ncbi:piggyBac transposable element-derived protein 3-like [Coccinella septempunctata]|uniref:piggyBac transposable element-derived protein 3-like n=1 Tax=Coccinella septempunctata TaxID=41139 RepID=UPI001D099B96|nr:piggyBac transposable element-derived protein 3-like [Coccinella septempunctata]